MDAIFTKSLLFCYTTNFIDLLHSRVGSQVPLILTFFLTNVSLPLNSLFDLPVWFLCHLGKVTKGIFWNHASCPSWEIFSSAQRPQWRQGILLRWQGNGYKMRWRNVKFICYQLLGSYCCPYAMNWVLKRRDECDENGIFTSWFQFWSAAGI